MHSAPDLYHVHNGNPFFFFLHSFLPQTNKLVPTHTYYMQNYIKVKQRAGLHMLCKFTGSIQTTTTKLLLFVSLTQNRHENRTYLLFVFCGVFFFTVIVRGGLLAEGEISQRREGSHACGTKTNKASHPATRQPTAADRGLSLQSHMGHLTTASTRATVMSFTAPENTLHTLCAQSLCEIIYLEKMLQSFFSSDEDESVSGHICEKKFSWREVSLGSV